MNSFTFQISKVFSLRVKRGSFQALMISPTTSFFNSFSPLQMNVFEFFLIASIFWISFKYKESWTQWNKRQDTNENWTGRGLIHLCISYCRAQCLAHGPFTSGWVNIWFNLRLSFSAVELCRAITGSSKSSIACSRAGTGFVIVAVSLVPLISAYNS